MAERYDRSRLRTVHVVPLTAFDRSGRVDEAVLARHIARLYAAGLRVFMPAAGTGEFHSLSAEEIVDVVRITRQASGADAQIFAPIGMQLAQALEVGKRSLEAGATGLLFMPPIHPYLSDAGVRDYYREVMRACPAPALVYKKGPVPSDGLLIELARDHRFVGVKYAVNDLPEFRRTVLADRGRIEWLCGSAERFAPYYMLAGASGYTTGAGNVCPHLTLAMHAAFAAGQWDEGMRLQSLILPIEEYRARDGDSYNISALKAAMKVLGEDFGDPRPPQRRITATEQAELEELLQPILTSERELERELASVGLTRL
jgi:4-hydroxy-tetrahydrodipicolinate synthase